MPEIRELVFWQPNLSHHYVPMIRELASYFDKVTICVIERISERRKSMGWDEPDTTGIHVNLIPAASPETLLTRLDTHKTVHIFSGTRGYPAVWRVFKYAIKTKSNCGFLGETLDWRGFAGLLRLALSSWDAFRIRKSIYFILANGDIGRLWYKRAGYPESLIYDWAYFTNRQDIHSLAETAETSALVKLAYVGRLSLEKGIVPLIMLLKSLALEEVELHIMGAGPQEEAVTALAQGYKNVKLYGMLPMEKVHDLMATMDYLILPSTGKDGWGAVVNEALTSGTPCIVSRYAGASSLIIDDRMGWTYDPANATALQEILYSLKQTGKTRSARRNWIIQHAQKFSAASGAEYLHAVMQYIFSATESRPVAPWKTL